MRNNLGSIENRLIILRGKSYYDDLAWGVHDINYDPKKAIVYHNRVGLYAQLLHENYAQKRFSTIAHEYSHLFDAGYPGSLIFDSQIGFKSTADGLMRSEIKAQLRSAICEILLQKPPYLDDFASRMYQLGIGEAFERLWLNYRGHWGENAYDKLSLTKQEFNRIVSEVFFEFKQMGYIDAFEAAGCFWDKNRGILMSGVNNITGVLAPR